MESFCYYISSMGDELGSATCIDPASIVSLCLQHRCLHHFSPWSGTTSLGAIIRIHYCCGISQNLGKKLSKNVTSEVSRIHASARSSRILELFGAAYAQLCHGQSSQFSSPKLQWLTRLHPLFAGPARTVRTYIFGMKRFNTTWTADRR